MFAQVRSSVCAVGCDNTVLECFHHNNGPSFPLTNYGSVFDITHVCGGETAIQDMINFILTTPNNNNDNNYNLASLMVQYIYNVSNLFIEII